MNFFVQRQLIVDDQQHQNDDVDCIGCSFQRCIPVGGAEDAGGRSEQNGWVSLLAVNGLYFLLLYLVVSCRILLYRFFSITLHLVSTFLDLPCVVFFYYPRHGYLFEQIADYLGKGYSSSSDSGVRIKRWRRTGSGNERTLYCPATKSFPSMAAWAFAAANQLRVERGLAPSCKSERGFGDFCTDRRQPVWWSSTLIDSRAYGNPESLRLSDRVEFEMACGLVGTRLPFCQHQSFCFDARITNQKL